MTTPPQAPPNGGQRGAQGGGGGQPAAVAVAPWPFPVGVFDTEIQNAYDNTITLGTTTKAFPDVEVEPEGWLRGLWFDINIVSTGNSATVAFNESAPQNCIDTVLLKGTNVPQTFGPFNGYDWDTINKYGGYQGIGDPRSDPTYTATTGSGGSGGSAHVIMYMPMEISKHDALGDLQNQSDNSVYRVALTAAAIATIYSTAPTAAPTMEITVEQDSYSEPVAALALGGRPVMDAPPLPGTRQCWQQEDDTGIPAGSHTTKITNGIGYAYRNVILKELRGGTSRANGEADFPDPLDLWLGGTRVKRHKQSIWKAKHSRFFEYITATPDSSQGPENGIRVLWWDSDVSIGPGNDARRKLFRTQDGNVFKLVGTWANAGTLFITSNYVIPRGGPANNAQIVA